MAGGRQHEVNRWIYELMRAFEVRYTGETDGSFSDNHRVGSTNLPSQHNSGHTQTHTLIYGCRTPVDCLPDLYTIIHGGELISLREAGPLMHLIPRTSALGKSLRLNRVWARRMSECRLLISTVIYSRIGLLVQYTALFAVLE